VPLERVLVTGGASGLGAAVVAALARRGAEPYVLDLRPPEVATTRHQCVDLADPAEAASAAQRAAESLGGLDAVVTCAGMDVPAPFAEIDLATWMRVVSVNLLGTAAVVHAALPALLGPPTGHVVTVASTLGHRAVGDATAYCASKFGVVGFTRALAAELRGRVGVTLLTPGGMRTAFFAGREARYRPPDDMPLLDPNAVAEAVVFALSQPPGCEVKELVVTGPEEPSWP
jgi:NAD(P)-dependent dehydrogenase (short-subunit alcohol dehydrogenase family)